VQLLVARQVSQDGNGMLEEVHMWLAAVAASYELQQAGDTATLCSVRAVRIGRQCSVTSSQHKNAPVANVSSEQFAIYHANLQHKDKHASAANARKASVCCLSVCNGTKAHELEVSESVCPQLAPTVIPAPASALGSAEWRLHTCNHATAALAVGAAHAEGGHRS